MRRINTCGDAYGRVCEFALFIDYANGRGAHPKSHQRFYCYLFKLAFNCFSALAF
jgi:hypothetical protein